MRFYFTVLFIIFCIGAYTQDTLYEYNSQMYSKKYILHDNDTFEYIYSHCTGVEYGKGHFKKTTNQLVFEFDTIPYLENFALYSNTKSSDDSLLIYFKTVEDSSAFTPGIVSILDYEVFINPDSKLSVDKAQLSSDSIRFVVDLDKISAVNRLDQFNTLTLYIHTNVFRTYIQNGKHILKKRKDKYLKIEKNSYVDFNTGKTIRTKHKYYYVFK